MLKTTRKRINHDLVYPLRSKGCSVERVRGIEPPYSAWEADVLPLNYTRERPKVYPSSKQEAVGLGAQHGVFIFAVRCCIAR
jgi:hypothetical protein